MRSPDGENEALFIADRIQKFLRSETAKEVRGGTHCAVLYRTNAQSRLVEEALRRYNIRYTMVGGFSFYERAEIKDLLGYLRLVRNPHDSMALQRVINAPRGASAKPRLRRWTVGSGDRFVYLGGYRRGDQKPPDPHARPDGAGFLSSVDVGCAGDDKPFLAGKLSADVAASARDWGIAGGYFASELDAQIFHDELAHMLLTQKVAFNSPVWFNVGCDRLEPNSDGQNWHWDPATGGVRYSATGYKNPQCSACFINSVEDSLESILTLAKTEGMLFKWGSGTGTNLSTIRGSRETAYLAVAKASGPLSFMRGFDAFAGVIKKRRQDAAGGQDGDPERGPPGHSGLHRVQGEGRGQSLHADQGRL